MLKTPKNNKNDFIVFPGFTVAVPRSSDYSVVILFNDLLPFSLLLIASTCLPYFSSLIF